jgi:REase_DpnII-MboI
LADCEIAAGCERAYPDVEFLTSSLRRLGSGALRPLIRRRRDRRGVSINDEYDLQDAVEMLLRSLYSDVRLEEATPSSAGTSSRMDLLLREDGIAVEVKVVVRDRSERQVKREILEDVEDYRRHPTVRRLVVAYTT